MRVIDATDADLDLYTEKLCLYLKENVEPSESILVIGIASGGLPIAEKLNSKLARIGRSFEHASIKCQRPSTAKKKGGRLSFLFKNIVKRLPKFLLNIMRVVEHEYLQRKRDQERSVELLSNTNLSNKTIVLIDDAIDSGHSIREVISYIEKSSMGSRILVSAFVQTQNNPVVVPDFIMHERVLVRFPWSMDAS